MYKSQARYPGAGKSDRDKELRFGQAIITNTGERDGRLKGKNTRTNGRECDDASLMYTVEAVQKI